VLQRRVAEKIVGIVHRVTFHNPATGWSVLKIEPFGQTGNQETVTVHQAQVFAGATMEFHGEWRDDRRYGRQFHATQALERKPASAASLEKYLGSGLIKGVGPKTARKIVQYFRGDTLEVFDRDIERLQEVPGIAQKKLTTISQAWHEHSKIRDVMMFLQSHGISTLFAVRIYQRYGDDAISYVQKNPYCLSDDFYGIGFFSADKVALSLGLAPDSLVRVHAAIKHVLAASREHGHCYLLRDQIIVGVKDLIDRDISKRLPEYLQEMLSAGKLSTRRLRESTTNEPVYYAKSLYFQEEGVAERLRTMSGTRDVDRHRVERWIDRYCAKRSLTLSDEQRAAVLGTVNQSVSILTGGPGCGKTTTTQVIAKLFEAMGKRTLLVAPTGRAAQRMAEVIEREAKTIHRLLQWKGGEFQVNQSSPLEADVVIIDECSMLDITLAHAMFSALPEGCQLIMIGDPDQLPSVGPGNVLKDIIASDMIPCYHLAQVFRQALSSHIIKAAHDINQGKIPVIASPFHHPEVWSQDIDCLFIDSDEITWTQKTFIRRVKHLVPKEDDSTDPHLFRCDEPIRSSYDTDFEVPDKFKHVDIDALQKSPNEMSAFKSVLKKIHPWSSLHYDFSAVDVIQNLYTRWLPKYLGDGLEIQVLSPMARGSLGTVQLNEALQQHINPQNGQKPQLLIGQRTLRQGDRVIHRRNNYDLNVFNGDIGIIESINTEAATCVVRFEPDKREVNYRKEDLMDLDLAYAITIHKSQGSEFGVVIIPVLNQHFTMLYRNLIYTGLTRAKKFAIFVGSRRALAMSIKNIDTVKRQTALTELLSGQ
jgi:exodeoxyribonuclease V alpha subunit